MNKTIVRAIREDHVVLRRLLKRVRKAREAMSPDLDEAYGRLHKLNDVHMAGEERYFYEPLKEHGSSREDALESLEEHHLLRILEKELDGMSKKDELWKAKFGLFAELSSHHFDEEEEKLFKELQAEVKRGRQQELGGRFEEEEQRAGVAELSAV